MDTNLKRAVAIKVLPEALASDVERLARFTSMFVEVLNPTYHSPITIVAPTSG
jgi:hypothetical protein